MLYRFYIFFFIFAFMKRIWVFILFLILSQSHKVARSQSDCLSDSACLRPYDFYENQIRLADSLYKNYLPQSNFEEVKAAVMFFDSVQLSAISRQRRGLFDKKDTDENILIAESRLLTAAKAHYYHAVGLTERDDIVGACEHYLCALEIMEPLVETSPLWRLITKDKGLMANGERLKSQGKENAHSSKLEAQSPEYEKIRFIALIYTRLGELFYNENYCDLAITKYRKALKYELLLEENSFIANTYKCLGNSYQLYNKPDSALYYYNESLRYNSSLPNKLDVDKSIAQILIDKDERDSAYNLIRYNLNKIDNYFAMDSYISIFGDIYYKDKEYDSALYYLGKSVESTNYYTKLFSSTRLSAIYDSIGNREKKTYYDSISISLSVSRISNEVDQSKLIDVYKTYKEKKDKRLFEIERARIKKRNSIIIISFSILVTLLLLMILRKHKYSKQISNDLNLIVEELEKKDAALNKMDDEIRGFKHRQSITKGKIKKKNAELRKKEEELKLKNVEIAEMKDFVERERNSSSNFKEYCSSEICSKILSEIANLSRLSRDTSELKPLNLDEFMLLTHSANLHLNNFVKRMSDKYPNFKKEDLYYLCLTIINLNDKQIAALFGVTYHAIRIRRKKICSYLGVDIKENLHSHLMM